MGQINSSPQEEINNKTFNSKNNYQINSSYESNP